MLLQVVNGPSMQTGSFFYGCARFIEEVLFFTSSTTVNHINSICLGSIGAFHFYWNIYLEYALEKYPYHRRHTFLPPHIPEMYLKSNSLVISSAYACAVIWELAKRLVRGLWHVAHEEVLGPAQHHLVGTPTILVSNQTEIRGYSDNGHDCPVLRLSLYM